MDRGGEGRGGLWKGRVGQDKGIDRGLIELGKGKNMIA